MKTIVITGASGSGKTYLSNKLYKLFNNSILIKTDSFYRDDILIRFLSIFLYDIYDRPFSMNKNKIIKTLKSIQRKDKFIPFYQYDFKRKVTTKSQIMINYHEENQFLIIEGIFAHRLDLNYQETINVICKEKKELCFDRRLKRDELERGRNIKDVKRKFASSWYLFHKNIKKYLNKNQVISINKDNKISYENLVLKLKKK